MTKLASADHVALILSLLNENEGEQMHDLIWSFNKDTDEIEEVPLPDEVRQLRPGVYVKSIGRTTWRSTGRKMYESKEDYFKKTKGIRHWPRYPFKKSHFTRAWRRKDGEAIMRKFDMFITPVYAITRELNNEIVSVFFYRTRDDNVNLEEPVLFREWHAN